MSVKSSKSDLGDKMARTWSVGVEWNNGKESTIFGDDVTFRKGMHILAEMVQKELTIVEGTELQNPYETLLADIKDIKDDPGIMEDSDMWEDETFYGPDDQEWFIVEN